MNRFTKPVDFATKEVEFKDFKMESEGSGGFTGYASTFGNFDSAKEAVVKGAFATTLAYFKKHGFVALNHDWNGNAIGYIEEAVEDEQGLRVWVKFHSTEEAQKVRTIMQERAAAGKSNRLSIGYKVLKSEPTAQGKLLKEVKLYEVSVVNVPANDLATIGEVKSECGTTLENKTLQLAAKALLLGNMAESDVLDSALSTLASRLRLKMWETLADNNLTMDEKISLCQAMLMEFATIGMRAVESFLQDPNAVAVAGEKAAAIDADFKAGRVLSNAIRESMKSWSGSMKTVVQEIDNLLLETRPDDEKSKNDIIKKSQDYLQKTDERIKNTRLHFAAMGIGV